MPEITRRQFSALGISSMFGLGLIGLPTISGAQETKITKGGTVIVGSGAEPSILTDIMQSSGTSGTYARILEGLLDFDFDFNPRPYLATEWAISPDGLRYTFKLRENVKWHDGKPFTSADVAYSLLTLKEIHPRRRVTFKNLVEVQTPDAHSVELVLSKPAPYLLHALAAWSCPILPKHIYDGSDPIKNPANQAPIGTGPFVFKEWVRGSHYTLTANSQYWAPDKPHVDQIVVRFIPDTGAFSAALEAEEIHIGFSNPIPYPEIDRLKADGVIDVDPRGYDFNATFTQMVYNLRNTALKDLRVRKAIAHAVDLQDMLQVVWYGHGILAPTAIGSSLKKFYDPDIALHAFDPAKAEALLDEAGHPKGADGKRISLRVLYSPTVSYVGKMAEYFRDALARIGVELTLTSLDLPTYITRVYTDGAFDLDFSTMRNGYDPTDGVHRIYDSRNIKQGLPWSNASHYANPRIDELFDLASVEVSEKKRQEQYFEVQKILHDDLPVLNLVQYELLTVFSPKLHDHTVGADGINGSWADLWLET